MQLTSLGSSNSLDSSTANTIAQAIQKQEGYYPGSLAYRNNNPGNLIYAGQAGARIGAGGYAAFPSYDAGYQALLNQIQLYASRGYSVQQMMNVYLGSGDPNATAPAEQGDSVAYAQTVAAAMGVSPDVALSDPGPFESSPASLAASEPGFSPMATVAGGAAALVMFLFLAKS